MDTGRPLISVGSFTATPRIKTLVDEILASGRISYGEKSRLFEMQFAAAHDCHYGVLSNSGTSSLHVALQAMKEIHGWDDGDSVIVPAVTFVATANIVLHNRLTPVLVDVEGDSFGIDPLLVSEKVTGRTRAIIPVHMLGQACDMKGVMSVARRNGMKVIEDSAEAMFVTHEGRSVGSMGDIGCFSMYVAHLLVAGVGGISLTDFAPYAEKMRSLVNHGLSIDNLNPDENYAPRPMLNRKFVFGRIGHSFRVTEFEASLALAGLEDKERMLHLRRRNAALLTEGLTRVNKRYNCPLILPTVSRGNTHSWMMYALTLNRELKLNLTEWLNAHNIETRDVPTLFQPCYNWSARDYPVAQKIHGSSFYVGCHPEMSEGDCEYIVETIGSYFARY